jgi:hypothetical protein
MAMMMAIAIAITVITPNTPTMIRERVEIDAAKMEG